MTEKMKEAIEIVEEFWDDLDHHQHYFSKPVVSYSDGPTFKMHCQTVDKSKPRESMNDDYIFDDAFWEVFRKHPLYVCHVSMNDGGRLELRFAPNMIKGDN